MVLEVQCTWVYEKSPYLSVCAPVEVVALWSEDVRS